MSDTHGHVQTLVASAARTVSGDSGLVNLDLPADQINTILDVSAVSGTAPTLDVYLQTSHNGGTSWTDVGHFTQVTAAKRTLLQWSELNSSNAAKADTTTGDGAIAAGTILNGPIVQSAFRVKWVIGGTTPSFTFSLWQIQSRLA